MWMGCKEDMRRFPGRMANEVCVMFQAMCRCLSETWKQTHNPIMAHGLHILFLHPSIPSNQTSFVGFPSATEMLLTNDKVVAFFCLLEEKLTRPDASFELAESI